MSDLYGSLQLQNGLETISRVFGQENPQNPFAKTVDKKKNSVHTAMVFLDISGAFYCTQSAAM